MKVVVTNNVNEKLKLDPRTHSKALKEKKEKETHQAEVLFLY